VKKFRRNPGVSPKLLHKTPPLEGLRSGAWVRSTRGELAPQGALTSSGPTEAQNNLIQATNRIGLGFRTFHTDRIRVLL
jgi:hypothetical protein